MKTTESIKEIAQALVAAQGAMSNPAKDRTALVKSTKGDYSYRYADLASVLDVVRPALTKHGIALIQDQRVGEASASQDRDGKPCRIASLWLTTRLLHTSGEWIETELCSDIDPDARIQDLGSAITYLRRYSLQSLLGVAAEEDDDGAAAAGQRQQEQRHPPVERQPPPERRPPPAPVQRDAPQPSRPAAAPAASKSTAPAPTTPAAKADADADITAQVATLKKNLSERVAAKIWALYGNEKVRPQRSAVIRAANEAVATINRKLDRSHADRLLAEVTTDRSDPDNVQGILDDLAQAAGMALPPLASGEERPPY